MEFVDCLSKLQGCLFQNKCYLEIRNAFKIFLYVYKFNTYRVFVKQMSYLMLSVVLYLVKYCNWKFVYIISEVLEIIIIISNGSMEYS